MLILLADDDPVQTHFLTKRLTEKGFKVVTAIDAIQAALAAIRRPPDAIILDIQMPGGTGYAVLKQLKTSAETKRIPVIVLSGSIDSRDEAKLRALGADDFLSKPVDLTQLLATLSKLLAPPVENRQSSTMEQLP
jgi:DNA-binding response OmpR family regulator